MSHIISRLPYQSTSGSPSGPTRYLAKLVGHARQGVIAALSVVVIWCCAPHTGSAATLDEGLRSYAEHDYRAALAGLEPWADSGEPEAQLALGRCTHPAMGWYRTMSGRTPGLTSLHQPVWRRHAPNVRRSQRG